MMNPEIKQKWVTALRSGNYQQGRFALCKNAVGKRKYCCLGVLVDIQHPEEWENPLPLYENDILFRGSIGCLDKAFRSEVGLSDEEQDVLMNMNDGQDGHDWDFPAIADWIERNL